jgi:predicted transposase YdaD
VRLLPHLHSMAQARPSRASPWRHLRHEHGTLATVQEGQGPRPFDVTTRLLLDVDPASWLAWAGLPVDGPVHSIDSELSTVLAEVDKVLQVDAPSPWLAHLELQSSRDRELPRRLLQYHALLLRRHRKPVASTVILLRPEADGRELSGFLEQHGPTGERTIAFNFGVVRVWERSADELLQGGIGTLPLAPLAAVQPTQLPTLIARIDERLSHETEPHVARELWTALNILMGLRYDREQIRELMRGVRQMRESVTYQAIVNEGRTTGRVEGRAEEARRLALRLGTRRFGAPGPNVAATLDAMTDIEALEALADRLLTAHGWDDLLRPSTPA